MSSSASASPATPDPISNVAVQGAPIVITANAVGTAQLIYTPVSRGGNWDEVTISGGTLDGVARRVYIAWGAAAAANVLPAKLCAIGSGLNVLVDAQRCRDFTDSSAVFGVYAYTDAGSEGLVAVLVKANRVKEGE